MGLHVSSQLTKHSHGRSQGHHGGPEEPSDTTPGFRDQKSNCHSGSLRERTLFPPYRKTRRLDRSIGPVPHQLTALQLGSSWLNTKGKKMQSSQPWMNFLRAEPLSDRNFCTTHTTAGSLTTQVPRPTAMPSPQTSPSAHAPQLSPAAGQPGHSLGPWSDTGQPAAGRWPRHQP